jgi:hypothetical protein
LAKLCRIISTNITTHVVLILIPSTSVQYLLDHGRRIRRCAARVHNSETPFVVALISWIVGSWRVRLHLQRL